MASYFRVTQPVGEPVSLAQAKSALNVDSDITADDLFIGMLIQGAREYAEGYCNRSFLTQSWRLTLNSFGDVSAGGDGPFLGSVQIEKAPIQSIDSITYLDMGGALQTITNPGTPQATATVAVEQKFALDLDGNVGRISPAFGFIWPITLPQIGAVKINFTAGYGLVADSPSKVPAGIANWLLMRVCTLYQNREEVAVMPRGKVEALPYVDRLLDNFVVSLA